MYEEMSTDGLTDARARVQRPLDQLLEVHASPRSRVPDAKEAGKWIQRVRGELVEMDALLEGAASRR